MKLPTWKTFLEAIKVLNLADEKISAIKIEFLNAEYFINCLANAYELQSEIPLINVDSTFGSKREDCDLYYDSKDITINISQKFIYKYFVNSNSSDLEKNRNEFLWGIAHEFFHHGRNHIAIWNHFGIKENDASSQYNHILRFLEDDADRLATKALYRHFIFYIYIGLKPYDVKLKVLNVLFNTIRIKIYNAKNSVATKHPAWATRLYSQIIELSEIDNTKNDLQNPDVRVTEQTYKEQILLTNELIKMENVYGDSFDLNSYYFKPVEFPNEDEVLSKFFRDNPSYHATQLSLDLYYLNETAKEIEVFLKTNCNLPGLSDPKRQWQPEYMEQI